MANTALKLTPEQIAKSELRKQQKELAKKPARKLVDLDKGRILSRPWIQLPDVPNPRQRVKVLTFNLLAQCLVRRDLFPTSDCLKAHQREHMIFNEITSSSADILCLQEVDRLEKLLPVLEQAGYGHVYAHGPRKKHGCLIAYRKEKYSVLDNHSFCYDEQDVHEGNAPFSRGSSFRTKNIGSLVAMRTIGADTGLIVATTHLFWHPRYTYERVRQVAILLRETVRFRDQINAEWPCIMAGDFNFPPNDPGYSLLVGDPILPFQEELLKLSRVVHSSIEPDKALAAVKSSATDDEEGAEKDPDKIITNARLATSEDGLLSTEELCKLASSHGHLKSSYDEGQKFHKATHSIATFGDRVPTESCRHGAFEPEWTSYTHYWKTVLDYIFILDPPSHPSQIVGLLQPHTTKNLDPGLPKSTVCGSDHVSLVSEICWE